MAEAGVRNSSWYTNSGNWEARPKAEYSPGDSGGSEGSLSSRNLSNRRSSSQKMASSGLTNKIMGLRDRLASARVECSELRQEASDLQEYSSVKITRASRYLGVLSEKARKLDQVAVDLENRVTPLRNERRRLLNLFLASKGNVQVFCRVRPEFEDEGPAITSFPNESTIRLKLPPSAKTNVTEPQYEFDRVYAPHVGQEDVFQDIQSTLQSALDGCNLSIFAYGQSGAGKTYTLEGNSGDPGIILRAVEELFHLASADASPAARTTFHITMVELHDDKVRDLLSNAPGSDVPTAVEMGDASQLKLVGEKIENVMDFARHFDSGSRKRMGDNSAYHQEENGTSVLLVTIHFQYLNTVTREKYHSKVSFVDMPASDDHLNVEASLSALGDVLAAAAAKEEPPYGNSLLTSVLADSVGEDARTVLIVNVSPCALDLVETLSSVNFGVHARNKPNADTSEEDARHALEEKENDLQRLGEENGRLEMSLKEADSQCVILLNALQKALQQQESKEVVDEGQAAKSQEELANANEAIAQAAAVTKKLEDELSRRDQLIERLHDENEKLFERLTAKPVESSPVKEAPPSPSPPPPLPPTERKSPPGDGTPQKSASSGGRPPAGSRNLEQQRESTSGPLVSAGSSAVKSTPAGEYLSAALLDFNPDQYDSPAAVGDGANKLLMLVLAAVIKAGAAREHEMLAEIRDAVFTFIRKMESRATMDTMLVSRVRILYIRSLCSRSSELQSIQLPSVERFLERAGTERNSVSRRSLSRENSPARSPLASSKLFQSKSGSDDNIPRFKVYLGNEKKSFKFSSIFGKFRGDQPGGPQQVSGGRLRETSDDARQFAVGNKALAALFVHTPAGELQRQIRSWLSQSLDPVSAFSDGGVEAQLEVLSTAIMDGWMSGLGVPQRPSTDALGQLLSDYTKLVYSSELQHLKDVAATLATEQADDLSQVAQLRSGLESVEHQRRKVMQQMRADVALLTKEEGGSPFRTPSSANEDARIASLISLEDILKQADEIVRDARTKQGSSSLKKALSSRLSTLSERMSTLLPIDFACAQASIAKVQESVDSVQAGGGAGGAGGAGGGGSGAHLSRQRTGVEPPVAMSDDFSEEADGDVVQWSVLQFNRQSSSPLVIKCGATPKLDLVVKATAKLQDKDGREIVSVVPSPSALNGLSTEEIKQILSRLPEAFSYLAMAKTADVIRARYGRLYKTLADRVPALRNALGSGTESEPPRDQNAQPKYPSHARKRSDMENFATGDVQ